MPTLLMMVSAAFWTEFLVSEINHCDTTMDCSQDGYGEGPYLPVMENCTDCDNYTSLYRHSDHNTFVYMLYTIYAGDTGFQEITN